MTSEAPWGLKYEDHFGSPFFCISNAGMEATSKNDEGCKCEKQNKTHPGGWGQI